MAKKPGRPERASVTKAEMIQAGAGRPQGSPNRNYADLVVLPPSCPMCEGTDFSPREQSVSRDMSGTLHDGRIYNRIVWYKSRCKACGQWVSFREFHLVVAGDR